jgi:hypothetical protein
MAVLDLLLERGADIHKGQLIHEAARRPSDDAEAEAYITKLMDLGLSINEVKYQNEPVSYQERLIFGLVAPLHFAAEFRSLELVRFLLNVGANPLLLDSNGVTARYWAEQRGGREDCAC